MRWTQWMSKLPLEQYCVSQMLQDLSKDGKHEDVLFISKGGYFMSTLIIQRSP